MNTLVEGKRHTYNRYSAKRTDIQTNTARLEEFENMAGEKELRWLPMYLAPFQDTHTYETLSSDTSPAFKNVEDAIEWMEKHDVKFTAKFIKKQS